MSLKDWHQFGDTNVGSGMVESAAERRLNDYRERHEMQFHWALSEMRDEPDQNKRAVIHATLLRMYRSKP